MSGEAVAIQSQDYKVADISLAEWGRREIAIAETEMPALMEAASQDVREAFDADLDMKIKEMIPMDLHHQAENQFAYSMFINLGVSSGEASGEQIQAVTSTFVNAAGTARIDAPF